MIDQKPLVIVVSGAPGSGKTTLARSLADYMRLPHVERDTVIRGIECTRGGYGSIDRGVQGIETYYDLLTRMIQADISLVTDGTIYKGLSEKDIKSKLVSIAHVVNVHARATDEHQRFYDREMNRKGVPNDWVSDHMAHLEKIYPLTVDPLDLGVTTIQVDTNDAYKPSIADLAETIHQDYEQEQTEEDHEFTKHHH